MATPALSAFRPFGSRWLLALPLIAALCPVGWADPIAPGPNDRQITLAVVSLVRQQHLSHHPLDKEIAERWLKSFLKALDPTKVYFYQSDIDEFTKHEDEIANAARNGDISFAYTVFRAFLQRVDERMAVLDELLAMPHDFTVDEELLIDREAARHPRDASEAREDWRKRVKYDLLMLEAEQKLEGDKARRKLSQRYHSLARRMHQIDGEELLEICLNCFTASFDPHTDYLSPDMLNDFEIRMGRELEGIGALLTSEDGCTAIKNIIPGGIADKNGQLKAGDKIVGVAQGETGPMVDVTDMKLRKVVKLIRGRPGTTVCLDVISGDDTQRKIVKIVRAKIELTDSAAKVFDVGRKSDGTPYRIGVIDLPGFYRDTANRRGVLDFKSATRDVRGILDDFRRKNVDAIVLDLRYNGGGSLPEAISLTGLFIGEGPVVQVKDADGRVRHLDDDEPGVAWPGPLVVLINKFSASASEILAGAIQDYDRGLIVGDHSTHGKGTVQAVVDLGQQLFRGLPNSPSLGALKLTIEQFYRPNGDSTQQRGVLADVELPSSTGLFDTGEAELDYSLAFDRVEPLPHKQSDGVNPVLRDQLRQLSQQRVQASDKFQEVLRSVARYQQQKAKKYVTLNKEKFLKEQAQLSADKETKKAIERRLDVNNGAIERDYYLNEALAITTDYLNLQSVAKVQRETRVTN